MNEIVLFETKDKEIRLPVPIEKDTVWLTQDQMSELFDTARSSIAYHIGKIFKEGELQKETSVEIFDRSKKHASPLCDGCKRIAASLFLEFLDRNKSLYRNGNKIISDGALVAITLMIAESNPEEKDIMTSLVMNMLKM